MTEQDLIAVLQESKTITAEFYPAEVVVPPVLKERTITVNGYYPAATDDADGYSSVTVVVPDREVIKRELNVTPSTATQTISVPSGVDGFDPVNVSAVTSDIDPNIIPENIKSGTTILGVVGTFSLPPSYRVFQKDRYNRLVNSTSYPWVPLPAGTTAISAYLLYRGYTDTPANILNGPIDLSTITECEQGGMYMCFSGCPGITSVDLSSLQAIENSNSFYHAFTDCTGITSADLRSLTRITATGLNRALSGCSSMFSGCTSLTSVNLSSLANLSGGYAMDYMFSGCSSLKSIDLSSLTTITGNSAMSYCFKDTKLSTLSFPSVTSASFGTRTNQFTNMLQGVDGCVVHFPSNVQSVIGSWTDVTNGFGGTNTTVLFDLPATE